MNAASVSYQQENCSQVLHGIGRFIRDNINVYIIGIILPIGCIVGCFSNSLVIYIFARGKQVQNQVPDILRYFYICIAIADISYYIPIYMNYFLGMRHLYYLKNSDEYANFNTNYIFNFELFYCL